MIETDNPETARKLIKAEKKPVIIKAKSDEFNRKMIEYGRFDVLLGLESGGERKDKLKQLDSGLNPYLARTAAKNNISIGIDLAGIENLDKKDKAIALARIRQNIMLCRKAKAKLIALNYKDKKDALSLLLSLGASSQQAKEAVS